MKVKEISTKDIELAMELLENHKREQKQKQNEADRRKKLHRELMLGIKNVYDVLGVPHRDALVITGFQLRRTIIGGYSVILNLSDKRNPVIESDYDACYKSPNEGLAGRQERWHHGSGDHYNMEIKSHNEFWSRYASKQKLHAFYENRIHECPFCGRNEAQPDKHKWEDSPRHWFSRSMMWVDNVSEMKKDRLHITPFKYSRCRGCKSKSHKQYLAEYEYNFGIIDKKKKAVYDAMYPSPIAHDASYFLEKRQRKTQSHQQDTNEVRFEYDIQDYASDYSGNVYLMFNNHTGRTKIGRTKNKPKFRERTLQSDEPDVELVFYRKVTDMCKTEKHMHHHFIEKRTRGEWFDLTDNELEEARKMIEKEAI